MRTFFIFILCLIVYFSPAQTGKSLSEQALIESQLQIIRQDTCLDKKFSVVFYVMQDSLSTLTLTSPAMANYSLQACINFANRTFSPICVSFEHCKTIILPDYTLNKWILLNNGLPTLRTYYTENTICVFVPHATKQWLPDDPESSFAFPPDTIPALRNSIICPPGGLVNAPFMHALGHFFGLPHTYGEINPGQNTSPPPPPGILSKEFCDKTNCYLHGDGFCDTDADPYPYLGNNPKASHGNCAPLDIRDGKNVFYTPPFDNYMSSYLVCRCKFTKEQYSFMAHYIVTKRMYLH